MLTHLILSDGKPGHLNQSRAYCQMSGGRFEEIEVGFRNRFCKGLSYLLDKLGIYASALLRLPPEVPTAATVVCAGSGTYYAARVLARRSGARAVAVMLPRGYRIIGFDLILAQEHDQPPTRNNILCLPINLCRVVPQQLFTPKKDGRYIGLVIGGPNKAFAMPADRLQRQIAQVFASFPGCRFVVATSRRTPEAVEKMLAEFDFAETWLFSQDPANPIPDFLAHCDTVFITSDSTSMISEAVSFGAAAVEVLPLQEVGGSTKFSMLIQRLAARGCLHLFDGRPGDCRNKIDLAAILAGEKS